MEPIGQQPETSAQEKECCCKSKTQAACEHIEHGVEKVRKELTVAGRVTRYGTAKTMTCAGSLLSKAGSVLRSCGQYLERVAPKIAAEKPREEQVHD